MRWNPTPDLGCDLIWRVRDRPCGWAGVLVQGKMDPTQAGSRRMTREAWNGPPQPPGTSPAVTWVSGFRPHRGDTRHSCLSDCLWHFGRQPQQRHTASPPSLTPWGLQMALTCLQAPKDTLQPVSQAGAFPACGSFQGEAELQALLGSRPLWYSFGIATQALELGCLGVKPDPARLPSLALSFLVCET